MSLLGVGGVKTIVRAEDLAGEIMRRRERAGEIREKINTYCRNVFGIKDFFFLVDSYFNSCPGYREKLMVCLARQVPCPSIEHLATQVFVEWLGRAEISASFVPLSFTRDSVATANKYKASIIKPGMLYRTRSGSLHVDRVNLLDRSMRGTVEGVVFDRLKTATGEMITDHHALALKSILGCDLKSIDLSRLFGEIVRTAVVGRSHNIPPHLYVRHLDRERKEDIHLVDFKNGCDPRPPAIWYYLFYLFIFTDGNCALVEGQEDGAVSAWFAQSIAHIKGICGFEPLIVRMPINTKVGEYVSELYEVPRWMVNTPEWRERINIPHPDADVNSVIGEVAKEMIVAC